MFFFPSFRFPSVNQHKLAVCRYQITRSSPNHKLGQLCGEQLDQIGQFLKNNSTTVDAQQLSNASLAIGSVLRRGKKQLSVYEMDVATNLYKEVLQIVIDKEDTILQYASGANLAYIIWSLGMGVDVLQIHLSYNPVFGDVYHKLLNSYKQKEWYNVPPNAYANVLWSISTVIGKKSGVFYQVLKSAVQFRSVRFKLLSVCNILCAMVAVGYRGSKEIQHYVNSLNHHFDDIASSFLLAGIVASLHKLRYFDYTFINKLEDGILKNRWHFQPEQVSITALYLANAKNPNKQAIICLLSQFVERLDMQNFRAITNFIFALALIEMRVELSNRLLFLIKQNAKMQLSNSYGMCQLRQAQVQYQSLGFTLYIPLALQQRAISEYLHLLHKKSVTRHVLIDKVFLKISQFFKNSQKYLIVEDRYLVDIAVSQGEHKLALVVLDHNQYTTSVPEELLGVMKRHIKMLKAFGWKVVCVTALKWDNKLYQRQLLQMVEQELKLES